MCQSHRRTLLSLSVKLVMHLALLVIIFVLHVCVGFFSSGFPLRRCVSGPPSLDLQSHDMEHNRYATFSATELRNYSRDYSEIPVDPDSPCTSSEQIGMFISSPDNSESWIQQDMDINRSIGVLHTLNVCERDEQSFWGSFVPIFLFTVFYPEHWSKLLRALNTREHKKCSVK